MKLVFNTAVFLLLFSQVVAAWENNKNGDAYHIYNSLRIQRDLINKIKSQEQKKTVAFNSNMSLPTHVLNQYIQQAALKSRLPKELIKALIKHESDFDTNALSHMGAVGLTQLLPSTADELDADPWDPQQNIIAGSIYLRKLYDRFETLELALWAYNAGPSRVDSLVIPEETKKYITKVIKSYHKYRENPLFYINDGH